MNPLRLSRSKKTPAESASIPITSFIYSESILPTSLISPVSIPTDDAYFSKYLVTAVSFYSLLVNARSSTLSTKMTRTSIPIPNRYKIIVGKNLFIWYLATLIFTLMSESYFLTNSKSFLVYFSISLPLSSSRSHSDEIAYSLIFHVSTKNVDHIAIIIPKSPFQFESTNTLWTEASLLVM